MASGSVNVFSDPKWIASFSGYFLNDRYAHWNLSILRSAGVGNSYYPHGWDCCYQTKQLNKGRIYSDSVQGVSIHPSGEVTVTGTWESWSCLQSPFLSFLQTRTGCYGKVLPTFRHYIWTFSAQLIPSRNSLTDMPCLFPKCLLDLIKLEGLKKKRYWQLWGVI